jgi:cyclophilin family peptidyl-prolyl cis-trans isomerase
MLIPSCSAQKDKQKGVKVEIETTMGDLVILLYDETPLHQQNFIKLVKEKYYDGVLFHRVIKEFMIQAGDPDSKTAAQGQVLGNGGPGYTIDAEFKSNLFHKKGALSAARTGDNVNPQKKSSGSQFYIVQGKKYTAEELNQMEEQLKTGPFVNLIRIYLKQAENAELLNEVQTKQQLNDQAGVQKILDGIIEKLKVDHPEIKEFKYTEEQKKAYQTVGGTPFLDMNYTVFGEVIKGMEIIDKIAAVATNPNDRPAEDIKIISMKILK